MLKLAIIFAAVAVCHGQLAANTYYLFSVNNVAGATLTPSGTAIPQDFVTANSVTILIHGHGESYRSLFNTRVRQQLVNQHQHNVIVVDWENRAGFSYANARTNVPTVARELTSFIQWLTGLTYKDSSDNDVFLVEVNALHLVGFDLGAHVAGRASRDLATVVGRITGLDPSGSGWGSGSDRLGPADANYVEVIHTDDSGLLANGIGTAIGHVDFFANGGGNQPGCLSHACSHSRAWELFESSLEYNDLWGDGCSTKTQLNLNRCRGARLRLGGTTLNKRDVAVYQMYRINTGRSYPF